MKRLILFLIAISLVLCQSATKVGIPQLSDPSNQTSCIPWAQSGMVTCAEPWKIFIPPGYAQLPHFVSGENYTASPGQTTFSLSACAVVPGTLMVSRTRSGVTLRLLALADYSTSGCGLPPSPYVVTLATPATAGDVLVFDYQHW